MHQKIQIAQYERKMSLKNVNVGVKFSSERNEKIKARPVLRARLHQDKRPTFKEEKTENFCLFVSKTYQGNLGKCSRPGFPLGL